MRRASAYRVFLTRNTEYHIRDHVCFGVRDRRSGQWQAQHPALQRPLAGAFRDANGRVQSLTLPVIGESLQFSIRGRPLFTSPILAVEEREGLQPGVIGKSPAEAMAYRKPPLTPRDTH